MESRYPSCYCKITHSQKIKVKFLAKDHKRYRTLGIPTHIFRYEKFKSRYKNFQITKKKHCSATLNPYSPKCFCEFQQSCPNKFSTNFLIFRSQISAIIGQANTENYIKHCKTACRFEVGTEPGAMHCTVGYTSTTDRQGLTFWSTTCLNRASTVRHLLPTLK